MKKYIVETVITSTWVWEIEAETPDGAKYNYDQGFVTSKVKDSHITVKEA